MFFRFLLAIPLIIWLYFYSFVAMFVIFAGWFAALFTGHLPTGIHNFLARFLRYQVHVYSYLTLVANPYPSFSGSASYPVDAEIAPPEKQGRLGIFFRLLLAIPALIFSGLLNYVSEIVAFFAWWVVLFLGRIPEDMRNILAYSVRFHAQTQGYVMLLTSTYPSFDTGS